MKTSKLIQATSPVSTVVITPILTGYFYAIKDSKTDKYSMVQVIQANHSTNCNAVKLRQLAHSFKVLPDFLVPEQLGTATAQFWLPMGEFLSWQPLLMQRGFVADIS